MVVEIISVSVLVMTALTVFLFKYYKKSVRLQTEIDDVRKKFLNLKVTNKELEKVIEDKNIELAALNDLRESYEAGLNYWEKMGWAKPKRGIMVINKKPE